MARTDDPGAVTVSVRNLGGIGDRELTFEPGVTLLTGRNATNRTSFLQAISAGLGGSYGELKADADAGEVTLDFDGGTATRRFERDGDTVAVTGDPYTDDATAVDLFSCLLAANPARRAVERDDGEALRDVVMRPVDTADVKARIERTRRELREVDDRIAELEAERDRLPRLERKREERRADLEDVEEELDEVRAAVDEYEADAEAAEEAEAVVDELQSTREEYERVRNRLETQRSALESLEDERAEVEADLDEASAPEAELEETKRELERRQRRERELENAINNLLSIVEFNEGLVEGESELPTSTDEGAVVDELDPSAQRVECWTCGTTVERGDIGDRLDTLREVVDEKRRERNELRTEIEELRSRRSTLREETQEYEALADRLDGIDAEIAERESKVDDLETRTADLQDEIDELEARAAESEGLRDSELLDRYQRLSELEYERGQLEERLDSLDAEIAELASVDDEIAELEADRDELDAELTDLRNRIGDMERAAVETFNEHMETVLDLLGYENVERVWIERKAGDGPEGTFDLHVVRATADGAVYEDTLSHLSESEREVIGLVVALAGYLVHDVHETVPMMLLDSLEAIDADRIAALVEYFADYAPYLVVALLPEDAQALSEEYDRVAMPRAVA